MSDSATDDAEAEPAPPQVGGIKKKTLIITGVVILGLYALSALNPSPNVGAYKADSAKGDLLIVAKGIEMLVRNEMLTAAG